jgi:catechol 2,3-dioxygenase-like lactoylglutathione lyase family enzyme
VPRSQRFYELVAPFAGFGLERTTAGRAHFAGARGSFSVVADTPSEHVHVAFPASDDATVDAFHRAATRAGHRDNGPPGERRVQHEGYYAAFVLDPDGNNVELVNHNG